MSFNLTTLWQGINQPNSKKENQDKLKSQAPEFSRDHQISFGSGQRIQASSAPEYFGSHDKINPEETLLASLSSCHMLTFLALAHKKRLPVVEYRDDASAELGINAKGKTFLETITLRPKVTFAQGITVDDASLNKMHEKAHQHCFIANSILSQVIILPES